MTEDSDRPLHKRELDLVTPKSTAEHGVLAMRSGTMSVTTFSGEEEDVEEVQPRRVLVAKRLTNSDASSGRIILPRVAVETNMSFVTTYKHYGLHVRDVFGQEYDFVVKSWANGTEHRRVFVLEQVSKFLKQHHIGVGDTVGICAVGDDFVVEVNSDDVKLAAVNGRCTSAPPATHHNTVATKASGASPRGMGNVRCTRSSHCSKGAGHPGFCSGPKAHAVSSKSSGRSGNTQYYSGEDSSFKGEWHPADDLMTPGHDTSSEDTSMRYENTLYISEDMVNKEMQQLPDGLNRLAYVPAQARILKKITAYDLSSRRIVLPADQASQGLLNIFPEHHGNVYTLAAVDESHGWQFLTLRSWYSVTGRLGYFIEDSNDFLKSRNAQVGDYFMLYRDNIETPPKCILLDREACNVKNPLVGSDAEMYFSELPLLLLPPGEHGISKPTSDSLRFIKRWHNGHIGSDQLMSHAKRQSHPGFCQGLSGAKRKERIETPPAHAENNQFGCVRNDSDSSEEYTASRKARVRRSHRGPHDPLVSLLNLLE